MKKLNDRSRAPIKYNQRLNFNGTSVAPEVPSIRKYADKILNEYQKKVPGSEPASRYLTVVGRQCQDMIRQLLLEPHTKDKFAVEFFSGTGRAVDVAAARIHGPKKIILSPFEHPTVVKVANWQARVACAEVCQIVFDPKDFHSSRSEQENKIVEQAVGYIGQDSRTSVVILSEICYATGLVLPYEAIIKRIRESCSNSKIRVIIDGAHAAGNGQYLSGLVSCDSYVFSAHKWLLSSEPCGILLSQQPTSEDLIPYDAWSQTPPSTTANIRAVAGIIGSLTVLSKLGFESVWAHSTELRMRFLERINSKFMVIGENSGLKTSLMLAICPRPGERWKHDLGELREYLERNSVHLLILSIDPDVPWIRIGFPCFIEIEQIDILCRILDDAIGD